MILTRYERMIARRYLLPGRGEAFIALVAGISLVAVMLGVAALIIVMSVMNGFRAELFDKIVGLNGHAVIQGYDGQLRDWRRVVEGGRATPGVTEATPMIEQPLMASFSGRVGAVLVRGMRVEDLRRTPTLTQNVQVGSLATLTPGSGEVAIGSRLAQTLGATLGSEIQLISPQGPASPFGTVPRIVSYTVGAIFEVGIYDFDKAYVVMPLEDAQTLLLMGDSIGVVELNVTDPDRVGDILAPLAPRIARVGVINDWRQMNASLFEALSVDRLVTTVVLSILILIATFNILSSLIMLVRAKTRDIAILRTMGATRGGMMRIFMTVGTAIGTLGIAAGVVLGFVVLAYRQGVVGFLGTVSGQEIWDPSMRFLTELPAKTDAVEVISITGAAFVMTVLATLYPAWRAASTDPVQVLRYD